MVGDTTLCVSTHGVGMGCRDLVSCCWAEAGATVVVGVWSISMGPAVSKGGTLGISERAGALPVRVVGATVGAAVGVVAVLVVGRNDGSIGGGGLSGHKLEELSYSFVEGGNGLLGGIVGGFNGIGPLVAGISSGSFCLAFPLSSVEEGLEVRESLVGGRPPVPFPDGKSVEARGLEDLYSCIDSIDLTDGISAFCSKFHAFR